MPISSLVQPNLVKCGMAATTKDEALREIVGHLASVDSTIDVEDVLYILNERERLGPFSLGKGAAFPHARTEKVKDLTIALGTSSSGIEFEAQDGLKVRIVVLFVIPKAHSNLYLHALAQFLKILSQEGQLERLVSAKTPEELIRFIDDSSAGQKPSTAGHPSERSGQSVTGESLLSTVVGLLLRHRLDALPVINGGGELIGEVSMGSLLSLGVRDRLLGKPSSAGPESDSTVRNPLRRFWETGIRDIPGLILFHGFPTIQEGESTVDIAVRVAQAGGRSGYLLKGRRLIRQIKQADLLQSLSEDCGGDTTP